jgi:hypothetical protein
VEERGERVGVGDREKSEGKAIILLVRGGGEWF